MVHLDKVTFNYQSQDISYPNWIELLTLCFAPLIAHIVAGAPKIVHLNDQKPRWHDYIVHYNPTSILWRYFAILDRRLRARNWTPTDLAVCNALFWTTGGWDGSEGMMTKARDICARAPPPRVKRLLSVESLKTGIVTVQGIYAIFFLFTTNYTAVHTIFMQLAIVGLVRLPTALWLTDDWLFVDTSHPDYVPLVNLAATAPTKHVDDSTVCLSREETSSTRRRLMRNTSSFGPSDAFHRNTSPYGITIRLFYILTLLGLLTFSLYISVRASIRRQFYAVTFVTRGIFYNLINITSIVIFVVYSFRHTPSATSTAVPCNGKTWYKAYTCFLVVLMLVMVITSGLETRQAPCGTYTVLPKSWNPIVCPNLVFTNTTAVGSAPT